MILISSAAYVDQDLAAEVGRLPPVFLPIGNKRLYSYQIDLLKKIDDDIYISLPETYQLESFDLQALDSQSVKIIRVPEGLTLGNSLLYCWNATGVVYQDLKVLHGDTLFTELDFCDIDSITVHANIGSYQRAKVDVKNIFAEEIHNEWVDDDGYVVSGYFSFSKPQLLMQGIIEAKGNFVGGLSFYAGQQRVKGNRSGNWLDFGHLNSFFRSRTVMTTQRAFNNLSITSRAVVKSSSDKIKMAAEANWFRELPHDLRIYTPVVLREYHEDEVKAYYSLEYLYLLPLSDLYVYGNLSVGYWKQALMAARTLMLDLGRYKPEAVNLHMLDEMYLKKTVQRLGLFDEQPSFDSSKISDQLDFPGSLASSLLEVAIDSANYINSSVVGDAALVHGDFCFSNILYDSRTQSLKLIDPRGIDSDRNLTLYGDRRYDLAKLYHSAVGCYDLIIAGTYQISGLKTSSNTINFFADNRINKIEALFDEIFFNGDQAFQKIEIIAINVHLFLSMLPLHSDRPDRQEAMIANAIRLYRKLKNMT